MKRYVFVAGVDYLHIGGPATDYGIYANRRMSWLARRHPTDDLKFIVIDFKRGSIVKKKTTKGGKLHQVERDESRKGITAADYEEGKKGPYFAAGDKNVLSITDVYDTVERIGRETPDTLVELSFFSHATWKSPVLVNSYDDRDWLRETRPNEPPDFRVPEGLRDPDDKDPRPGLDFTAPTMDRKERERFRNAFASDGYIWLWGCAFPSSLNKLLGDLERDSDYSVRGMSPTTKITLRPRRYKEFYKIVFDSGYSGKPIVKVEFDNLRLKLCQLSQQTYASHIATAAQATTYAAPLGTDSRPDKKETRPKLLHVASQFKHRTKFYSNHMPLTDGRSDRGYVGYPPNMNCTQLTSTGGKSTSNDSSGT